MALVKCRDCKTEVSTDAKACPKCGSTKYGPRWTKSSGLNAGYGLLLLMFIGICTARGLGSGDGPTSTPVAAPTVPPPTVPPVTNPAQTAAAKDPASPFSEAEEKYLGAAGGYLQSVNKYDTELAMVMAGAQTGESTLGDIKDSINRTRRILDAAYFGDYESAAPPQPFVALNKKIDRCKKLHDSAFKEMLEYWKDSNTAHIVSGTATFERAVVVTNECIEDLRTVMTRGAEERRKAAPAPSAPRAGKPP